MKLHTIVLLALFLCASAGCNDKPAPPTQVDNVANLESAQHQAYIACFETGVLCADHVMLTNILAGNPPMTGEALLEAASEQPGSIPSMIHSRKLK